MNSSAQNTSKKRLSIVRSHWALLWWSFDCDSVEMRAKEEARNCWLWIEAKIEWTNIKTIVFACLMNYKINIYIRRSTFHHEADGGGEREKKKLWQQPFHWIVIKSWSSFEPPHTKLLALDAGSKRNNKFTSFLPWLLLDRLLVDIKGNCSDNKQHISIPFLLFLSGTQQTP
jgi:hypothetical protein